MADAKITELTELTTPADADLLAIVDDPSGSAVTKKITRGTFNIVKQATVTLTDAQIKALPSTPIVIVPATETINYSGRLTELLIPLSASILVDTEAGAYTNVNLNSFFVLAVGSDWSDDYARISFEPEALSAADRSLYHFPLQLFDNKTVEAVPSNPHDHALPAGHFGLGDDNVLDNAIALALHNQGSGALLGGHASNFIVASVLYGVLNVSTGVFE